MTSIRRGKQPLSITHPDLAKEWDYEKNAPVTPNDVTAGSPKKVWWKCKQNHNFDTVISSRTNRGTGCPYCSKKKLLVGFNDLATLYPDLAAEWNYDKNDMLTPENVVANSQRLSVWWKCSEGHVWEARLDHRIRYGSGCPFCSGRNAIPGENDFATYKPDLVKEWNYVKNGCLKPSDFTRRSGQKVWWKCAKGHEWEATIHNRSDGHGCPYCAGLRAITGYNDLLSLKPDYIDEWDYDRNIGISPSEFSTGSGKKVWWKCRYGHVWKSAICDRTRGNSCPRCQYKGTSKPEQGIVFYLSQYFVVEPRAMINKQEIDVYLPEYKIGIEYDGRYYHKDSQLREAKKNSALSDAGIVLFRIKESKQNSVSDNIIYFETDYLGSNYVWALHILFGLIADLTGKKEIQQIDVDIDRDMLKIREQYDLIQKENSLTTKFPAIAKEWNYKKNGILTPDMFYSGSAEKVWWRCSKGHEWEAIIYSRVGGTGCPYCSGRLAIEGETDFSTLRPELVKEWNYEKNGNLNPSSFTVSSGEKVWWKCSKGHEWQNTIHGRSAGHSCPYCAGKRVLSGFNDLSTLDPDLAKEWDYDKNGTLKPSDFTLVSGVKVWWKCEFGHEWESTIANRSKGRGCPFCKGKRAIVGDTDLATMFPDIVKEWNYEKNEYSEPSSFTSGSRKKVWWRCSKGHEWEASIVNRTRLGRGCPYCSGQRVLVGENDLQTINPKLAQEWNYEKNVGLTDGNGKDISTPDKVMHSSNHKVWWRCPKGHEWQTTINTRAGGAGCPYCAENLPKAVINLETGEIFSSAREASLSCGANDGRPIASCCRGERKSAYGYHWKYK